MTDKDLLDYELTDLNIFLVQSGLVLLCAACIVFVLYSFIEV